MDNATETPRIVQFAELVRSNSQQVKLTKSDEISLGEESLTKDEVDELLSEVSKEEDYADIQKLSGSARLYIFSDKLISGNYAKLLVRIEEKDLLGLVAETVREESRIYPRPTDIRLFSHAPYSLSPEDYDRIMDQIKASEDYQDIGEVVASNGAVYLYSEKHMGKRYAQGLAEWIEVEEEEIP